MPSIKLLYNIILHRERLVGAEGVYEFMSWGVGQSSVSQSAVPRPAVIISPGNLLELQILGIYPRPIKSVTLG